MPRSTANPIVTAAIAHTVAGMSPSDATATACSGHVVTEAARERIEGLCLAARERVTRQAIARRAETACAAGGAS